MFLYFTVDTLLYRFVAFQTELTSVSVRFFLQSLSRPSGTSPENTGLSSMEPAGLCCPLYKALTLDPVPVIGDMIYVPGAEGVRLRDLTEDMVKPCQAHKYNFKNTTELLLRYASRASQCSCESSSCVSVDQSKDLSEGRNVSPFVHNDPAKALSKRPGGGGRGGNRGGSRYTARTLWAYEIDNVVTAYRWLMQNRSYKYPKCCDTVIVYQLRKSQSLPSGLYVYRTHPAHFGCTAERPLTVVEQFNFVSQSEQFISREGLPSSITIEMFPGCDNFSALYVINRNLAMSVPEYGNRMFGEARALGIIEGCAPITAVACEHHEVAMRTERVCVIDLRWKGFHTKTACNKAIPRVRGLQAVVWSNHNATFQDIECKVLTWIFGLSNELPKEVQLIDYKSEAYGLRYILMDMETFPGVLPQPPSGTASFFIHTHFMGDFTLAINTIGMVSEGRSRIGSPCENVSAFAFWYELPALGYCQPTPFSCGVRYGITPTLTEELKSSLLEWALSKDGTSCLAIAVQHTLYYHAGEMKYKMMVSHTVMDNDTTLHMFKL